MIRKLMLSSAATLLISGCASHEYVDRHLASLDSRQTAALQAGLQTSDAKAAAATATAMARANAAHTLAEGKFAYSMTLSDAQLSFAAGKAELTDAGKTQLTALASRFKAENKNVFLEIRGHTDNLGTEAAKLAIGQARAEAVRLFLNMQGVALNRIGTISYADSAPLAPNTTEAGRAQNRRVVIVVAR